MRESAFSKRQNPQNISQALPGIRRIVREFAPEIRQQQLLLGGAFRGLMVEVAARLMRAWAWKCRC
ncbi:MAG: hypothetical protein ACFCAD_04000, partial [Pleurocapsa sp.]